MFMDEPGCHAGEKDRTPRMLVRLKPDTTKWSYT